MRIGGLSLFTRTSVRRNYGIASYRPANSPTWRWACQLQMPTPGIGRWFSIARTQSRQVCIQVAKCALWISWQPRYTGGC